MNQIDEVIENKTKKIRKEGGKTRYKMSASGLALHMANPTLHSAFSQSIALRSWVSGSLFKGNRCHRNSGLNRPLLNGDRALIPDSIHPQRTVASTHAVCFEAFRPKNASSHACRIPIVAYHEDLMPSQI